MQHFANKIEKSLIQLAKLLGIPIKLGWKTELSKWIGIKRVLLATWIHRDNIPKKRLAEIENKGYPPEKWMIYEEEKEAIEVKETQAIYGIPNKKELYRSIDIILASKDRNTIQALDMNVKVFLNKVIDKKNCEEEIENLKRELRILQNQVNSLLKKDCAEKKRDYEKQGM